MGFKVGDTVEVIDDSGNGLSKIGDIGIVIECDTRNECIIYIKTLDGRIYGMYEYRFKITKKVDKLAYLKNIKKFGIVKFMEES